MTALDKGYIKHTDGIKVVLNDRQCFSGESATGVRHSGNNFIMVVLCFICAQCGVNHPNDVEVSYLERILRDYCRNGLPGFVKTHGDDSIWDIRVQSEAVSTVAAWIGWEAKAESGYQWDLKYLARTYLPEGGSCCDVRRSLIKYHISASVPGKADARGLLAAKALSYLATDYNTPLVGAVSWACLQLNLQYLHSRYNVPFMERLKLRNVSVNDLLNRPPPLFSVDKGVMVAMDSGIPLTTLREKHYEWIFYGMFGGSQPDPIRVVPVLIKTFLVPPF